MRFAVLLLVITLPAKGISSPLITSSEDTYARVCLEQSDSNERLVDICSRALSDPGVSISQRMDILDTLGTAYRDLDQLDVAEATFNRILNIQPKHDQGLAGLGWVHWQRDDYEASLSLFQLSVDVRPTAGALAGMAASLEELGQTDLEQLLLYYDAALALEPDYPWVVRQKGWLYIDNDDYGAALISFDHALNLDPESWNALAGRVRALGELRRYKEALEAANALVEQVPDSVWALNRRSWILYEMERYAQAVRDADTAISLNPKASEGYRRKAKGLDGLGRRQDALAVLENALDDLGDNDYLIYWYADLLSDDGRYDEAERQIRRNISSDAVDVYDHQLLGYIALETGDYETARIAVDAAFAMGGNVDYTVYQNARLFIAADEIEKAVAEFDRAISMGLSTRYVKHFVRALIAKGALVSAISVRRKYKVVVIRP